MKIGCIEEIAYREGLIDAPQLERLAQSMRNDYGQYLLDVVARHGHETRSRFGAAA
jgi:glucose-1-phosphate thymidylyltransferase